MLKRAIDHFNISKTLSRLLALLKTSLTLYASGHKCIKLNMRLYYHGF